MKTENKMKDFQDITHSAYIDAACAGTREARDAAFHATHKARKDWETARAAYDAARATYDAAQETARATYDAACDVLVNPIEKIHHREKPCKLKYNNPWNQ